jgi:hypothetical protein
MKNRGPKFPVAGTVDEDEPMDSRNVRSRQQFLNYCQTNHCQFDELQRITFDHDGAVSAAQSDGTFGLNQCGACYRITHGYDIIATIVPTIYAKECYEPVAPDYGRSATAIRHAENHSFTPVDMPTSEETEKTRERRQLTSSLILTYLSTSRLWWSHPTAHSTTGG